MRSSLDEFRKEVQSVVLELISTQGYATVSRIRDAMCAKAESVTHRRIERVLPGILARHGLLKMTSNKTMKERLCIAGAGYGKVILPRNGSYC